MPDSDAPPPELLDPRDRPSTICICGHPLSAHGSASHMCGECKCGRFISAVTDVLGPYARGEGCPSCRPAEIGAVIRVDQVGCCVDCGSQVKPSPDMEQRLETLTATEVKVLTATEAKARLDDALDKPMPGFPFDHRSRWEIAYCLLTWELLKCMDPVTECVAWEKIISAMTKAAGELS